MSGWLLGLLPLAALVAAVSFLAYGEGEHSATVRFALSAILLSAAVLSAVGAAGELLPQLPGTGEGSLPETGEVTDPQQVAASALAAGLHTAVCEHFSLREEEVTLTLDGFVLSEMRAARVTVLLCGRAALADAPAIRRFVEEKNGGVCHVDIVF